MDVYTPPNKPSTPLSSVSSVSPSSSSSSSSSSPPPPKNHNWISVTVIITAIVVIMITLIGGALIFYNPELSARIGLNISHKNDFEKQSYLLSDDTVKLPLPLNNPSVFRAAISYSIIGIYEGMDYSGGRKELLLKDGDAMPPFPIEQNDTRFYWWDDAKRISASAQETDLKPNNKVRINFFYSLKRQEWFTHQVFIYTDAIPEGATPAAITE